jgi:hypothetical protein
MCLSCNAEAEYPTTSWRENSDREYGCARCSPNSVRLARKVGRMLETGSGGPTNAPVLPDADEEAFVRMNRVRAGIMFLLVFRCNIDMVGGPKKCCTY